MKGYTFFGVVSPHLAYLRIDDFFFCNSDVITIREVYIDVRCTSGTDKFQTLDISEELEVFLHMSSIQI